MARIDATKGMRLRRNKQEYEGEWDEGEKNADLKHLMNTLLRQAVLEVLEVNSDWVKLIVGASTQIHPGAVFDFDPERLTDTYFRVISG